MTTTILLSFAVAIVIAYGAGVFGAGITWRRQPANVTDKELRVLRMLWMHQQLRVMELVLLIKGAGRAEMYVLLGHLQERGLVVWSSPHPLSGAIYSLTTEGIQICALNDRLKERAA